MAEYSLRPDSTGFTGAGRGWMAQGFFTASEIPLLIRIAVGAIGAGGLLLIAVAVRDRLKKPDKDEFKEVER